MTHTTIQNTAFHHAYKVMEPDLNRYGIMHGGRLLTLCDEVGYIAARKHAGCDCLTRAVHQTRFHHAIEEGEHLTFRARVGLVGHSSLWVLIEVSKVGSGQCAMDAVFVYAAIDENMNTRQVPAIDTETDEEKQLQARLKRLRDTVLGV